MKSGLAVLQVAGLQVHDNVRGLLELHATNLLASRRSNIGQEEAAAQVGQQVWEGTCCQLHRTSHRGRRHARSVCVARSS